MEFNQQIKLRALERRRRWRGTHSSLALFAVAALAVLAFASPAMGAAWSLQTTANHPVEDKMKSISCPSTTFCMAAVRNQALGNSFLETWNGSEWTLLKSSVGETSFAGEMKSVSCLSATSCMVIGSSASSGMQAWRWTFLGSPFNTWQLSKETPPTPGGGIEPKLKDVSCTAEKCTAVGTYTESGKAKPLVERYGGSSWTTQTAPSPAEGTAAEAMLSVSCSSATACTTVGTANSKPFAERWNGTEWSTQSAPNPTGATGAVLNGVSCPTTSWCLAVGNYHESAGSEKSLEEIWNGTSWSVGTIIGEKSPSFLNDVSCTSSEACMGAGSYVNASSETKATVLHWKGINGVLETPPNPTGATESPLVAVSCTTELACTAVGSTHPGSAGQNTVTFGERWTGSWSLQTTYDQPVSSFEDKIKSVSCPTTTFCMAVARNQSVGDSFLETWNGSEWSLVKSWIGEITFSGEMKSVSCVSTTHCMVVGSSGSGGMEAWNWGFVGSPVNAWEAGKTTPPTPSGGTEPKLKDVSCTAETACTAVGSYTSEGKAKPLVERYGGSGWTVQTAPSPAEGTAAEAMLSVSCSSATTCTTVGTANSKPFAERWNGTEWSTQSAPNPTGATGAILNGVSCPSTSWCMAVGNYHESTGAEKTLTESWNGTSWSVVSSTGEKTASYLNDVSCTASTFCMGVGDFINASSETKTLALSWNGTSWSSTVTQNPTGSTESVLVSVSCPAASVCTAAGSAHPGSAGQALVTLGERYE